MSDAAPLEVKIEAEPEGDEGLGTAVRRRIDALKAGDVGSLPVIVGMILITIFFTAKTNVFFTAVNFDNLIPQMAQVTVMAMGVVFVLLIGEIDLSIGYLSGLAAVVVAELQLSGSSHAYPWYIAIGRSNPPRSRHRCRAGVDRRLPSACRRSSSRSQGCWPGTD